MPVATSPWPAPSSTSSTSIAVSRVLRVTAARRALIPPSRLAMDRHGTIWASAVTTMSVPPRALISGITRGRSARGTAALSAKP